MVHFDGSCCRRQSRRSRYRCWGVGIGWWLVRRPKQKLWLAQLVLEGVLVLELVWRIDEVQLVVTLGWLGMLAIVPCFWRVSSGVAAVRLVGAFNE